MPTYRAAYVPPEVGSNGVGVLLTLSSQSAEPKMLDAFAYALRDREPAARIGVGRVRGRVLESASSLREARQVVEAATGSNGSGKLYHRHADLRLRGLLHALGDDPRVQQFTESELGALLEHDARHGSDLVALLRQFLSVGGNKVALARVAHRSRSALYVQLAKLEEILGFSLDDAESRLSLGVALLAHDQGASRRSAS